MNKPNHLIVKASEVVGGQSELGRRIGMKKQFLSQLAKGERSVPPRWCIPIEKATDREITRYDLRPDIFGSAEADVA